MPDIKRPNYFTSQFLVEADFDDEQNYHRLRLNRHNQRLHTAGVAFGLEVTASGTRQVTIGPGLAVDANGQEIVLSEARVVDLGAPAANTEITITIWYAEFTNPDDRYKGLESDKFTRISERPKTNPPDGAPNTGAGEGPALTLAVVTIGQNSNIAAVQDRRTLAGSRVPDGSITFAKLAADVQERLVKGGDRHDHTGGAGAQLKHSTLNLDDGRNPHKTRAQDLIQPGGAPILPPADALPAAAAAPEAGGGLPDGGARGDVAGVFLNAGGQRLQAGDVVKLKGTPVTRFRGDNNRLPVPEVTLADKADDPQVIGVVAGPAARGPDGDPGAVEEGAELYVVTCGVCARCKADASDGPIAAGDLLTSAATPGSAKKSKRNIRGSILGKALEPLAEGAGTIAVLINLH